MPIDLHNLDQAVRDKLAQTICKEIDASEQAKGQLPMRWKRNEDIYHVVPGTTGVQVIEGLEAIELPLWRLKADRIRGSTVASLTGIEPYVQVISEGGNGQNDDAIERSLMAIAEKAEFKKQLTHSIRVALNTNIGVMRFRPKVKSAGTSNTVEKIEGDWHHPRNMMCYPEHFGSFEDAKTVGHRFWTLLYRLKAKMGTKEYFSEEVTGGDDPKVGDAGSTRHEKTQTTSPNVQDDAYVEQWEVIHECDLGDGIAKYLCTVAKRNQKLLKIQTYPYPLNWYVEVRADDEGGQIWPNDSPAQSMHGISLAFSSIHTHMIHGSLASYAPIIAIMGGNSGATAKKYSIGAILQLDADAKIQSLPVQFNPGALPEEGEKLEQLADGLTGMSRLGTGENLPSGTTATAAAGFLQGQTEAKNQYTEAFSPPVKYSFDLFLMYLRAHFADLKNSFQERIPLDDASKLDAEFGMEVTGQSGNSNPSTLIQKVQLLDQMAQRPTSGFDPVKTEQKIADLLEFPWSTSTLQKDDTTKILNTWRTIQGQGQDPAQILEMGMQSMVDKAKGGDLKEYIQLDKIYPIASPFIQAQIEHMAGLIPDPAHAAGVRSPGEVGLHPDANKPPDAQAVPKPGVGGNRSRTAKTKAKA